MRDKVSGAIAIPKASWGCAPALPNHIQSVFLRARFSVSHFRCNCSPGTVARYLFAAKISQDGAVLFAPPRKAVAFLTTPSVCQKHGTGISLPAGSDQGYSPWTSPAFLKNCWIKKLLLPTACNWKAQFLEKPIACGSLHRKTFLSVLSCHFPPFHRISCSHRTLPAPFRQMLPLSTHFSSQNIW